MGKFRKFKRPFLPPTPAATPAATTPAATTAATTPAATTAATTAFLPPALFQEIKQVIKEMAETSKRESMTDELERFFRFPGCEKRLYFPISNTFAQAIKLGYTTAYLPLPDPFFVPEPVKKVEERVKIFLARQITRGVPILLPKASSADRPSSWGTKAGADTKSDHRLLHRLGSYLRTLKAVHSGADLESAISNCMGYRSEDQGFKVCHSQINPTSGMPYVFPDFPQFALEHVHYKNVEALLEVLLEVRQELRALLSKPSDRLKDLLFLDIAVDSAVTMAIERGYEELNNAGPEKIVYFITLVLENVALSSNDNGNLIYCLKGWHHALNLLRSNNDEWEIYAKSVLDRTRLALAGKAEWYQQILQPSAEYLGSLLAVTEWAVNKLTEGIIRGGSAAALSSLINRLDPVLRKTAHLGSWQVISPVEAVGYVVVVDELLTVQNKSYDLPTILVAKRVKGEEEIPDGAVAVLTPDMPCALSHVSVRARNRKICFAMCFDPNILNDLQSSEGKLMSLKPTSAEVVYSELNEHEFADSRSANVEVGQEAV